MLNIDSLKPLYKQMESDIRQAILNKKYLPGQKLPSEEEFCQQYGVSRVTARRAIRNLLEQNLLERKRAKGTFVKQQEFGIPLMNTLGFTDILKQSGHLPHHSILLKSISSANEVIASKLNIQVGDSVMMMKRIIYEDGSPMAIDEAYMSSKRFPGIMDELTNDSSLYRVLQDKYKVSFSSSEMELRISLTDADNSALLEYPTGEPLYEQDKIVYDTDNQVVHYSHTLVRNDRVYYIIKTGANYNTKMTSKLI